MNLGIIGGGKVGTTLGLYLKDQLRGITAHSKESSEKLATYFKLPPYTNEELVQVSDVIFITVPDRMIGPMAYELAQSIGKRLQPNQSLQGKTFLHCSGSLGLETLAPLQALGASTGSLHPLQSFAIHPLERTRPDTPPHLDSITDLNGVFMALDGDNQALQVGEAIVNLLKGHAFHVPAQERPLYHAAACLCSNYVVTLETLATKLMSRWAGEHAWEALRPLFEGTVKNLTQEPPPKQGPNPAAALTGPIARGDKATIKSHLDQMPVELKELYCVLGRYTTTVAVEQGYIDSSTAQSFEALWQEMLTK